MTEQTERLKKALRTCAERGISPTTNPWPVVEERVATSRSRPARRLTAPRTRAGWAFAVLATLLAATGAYGTAGLVDVLDRVFGETVPYIQQHDLSTPVDARISRGGVTVTVDRVYADSDYVAVGYTVEGRDKIARRYGSEEIYINNWMELRDARGLGGPTARKYEVVDGQWQGWGPEARARTPPKGAEVGTEVFRASKPLEAGEEHRFRAEIFFDGPTGPVPENGSFDTERLGHPFFLDVRVPVSDVSQAIQVDQTVAANGVPITLTRAVNSPAKTSVYLCFDPPQRKYDWPLVKTNPFDEGRMADAPVYHIDYAGAEDGCAEYAFDSSLYGRAGTHSLTISELYPSGSDEGGSVKGPWRFALEIPEVEPDRSPLPDTGRDP